MNIKLQPIEVVRDDYGFFYHPEYYSNLEALLMNRESPTAEEWAKLQKDLGITISHKWLEDDASAEIRDLYFDGNVEACALWNPSKPDSQNDWFIISIHDTEDGPICLWAKPVNGDTQ